MISTIYPQINEKFFFMDKEIIILNVYKIFQLAQVRYVCSQTKFMVDINVLSRSPNKIKSISIKILGEV
ncbi:hypothetical protein SAMN04488500_1438 [Sporomusa malonica]|uniref:Uncharacterized protein n=1 Tax=Sporomusa malonica TaxID=112901 RepID=A0A1W2F3I0_9FIRM|nr:hypothetical protein SAMN04488500_1438 [Sporomusa malonica]